MNIVKLSISNLRFHALNNMFNVLILALGIAIIITLLHVSRQMEDRFETDLQGIDLVVGAKGSPIQLILANVFHLDTPIGNIPLDEADKLQGNMLVKSSTPLALGDSYQGFRIVGTTPEYAHHYNAKLQEGTFWAKDMQVVLGSEVARATHLKLNENFVGSHGLSEGGEQHSDSPYLIMGILKPTGTVIDRLILTDVSSVWHVHEHHHHEHEGHHDHDDGDEDEGTHGREITSLLLSYKSPLAAATLPRLINKSGTMQAASPAFEMARLRKMIGVGSDSIELFGGILVGIAGIGFFVTLFSAVNDRSYDIALMRSLGASRRRVFSFVLAEGISLGFFGIVSGIILGHLFAYAAQIWLERARHVSLTTILWHPYEFWIIVVAVGISIIAALIPAFMAYKINVAQILAKGS
jgi:putative ABC transport system permease protein